MQLIHDFQEALEMGMARLDLTKSSQDIIRDLIYHCNGFMLPSTGVNFGTPQALAPLAGDPYRRDTLIQVSMDDDAGGAGLFTGSKIFLYRRIDLSTLEPAQVDAMPIQVAGFPTATYTLLAQINAYYGLSLDETDVQNTAYDSAAGALLSAALGSLAYEGSCTLNLLSGA